MSAIATGYSTSDDHEAGIDTITFGDNIESGGVFLTSAPVSLSATQRIQ